MRKPAHIAEVSFGCEDACLLASGVLRQRRIRVSAFLLLLATMVLCLLVACTPAPSSNPSGTTERGTVVHVASLKGPTSIGLAGMMGDTSLANNYQFAISGTVDEIVPGIVKGSVDIALIPANIASTLYAKTSGEISVLDINTLGVLSVVTGDASLRSLSDLAGHTIYMTGKGTTPEYVMTYLLRGNGLIDDVTLEYKSEATEVAALLLQNPSAIGALPEPYVTSVCARNNALTAPISLTNEWDLLQGSAGSRLVTGVTVVRNEFLREHPDVVEEFLKAHAASVVYVNAHPDEAAAVIVSAGIMDDVTLAARAIPACNVVCLTGDDMRVALSGYLRVLYDQNASSVGGLLPGEGFYYRTAS